MRSHLGLVHLLLAMLMLPTANAEPWSRVDPASAGWSVGKLKAAEDYALALKPTGIVVVQDGKLAATWGDVARPVNVASVRKSLISALYGIAVSEGRIGLNLTLADIGIDDKPPSLTAIEKQATVRDLLKARSGVYHLAAYETSDMAAKRPERGSHAPGTFWYYNNWDFNALGTIYRRLTGEDIFASFESRIARPIGMEDFSARNGRYHVEAASIHAAYPVFMSARDLARFGQLFLDLGKWQGKQVVPAAWVKEATTPFSRTDRGKFGYGYLWWTLPSEEWGHGAALASGFNGQLLAVIPSMRLVVAQVVDRERNAKGIRTREFISMLRMIAASR